MKKFIFFALVCAFFVACSSDNDDNGMSNVRADMVDMHVIGVKVKSIVTDDGVSLPFEPMELADKYSRVDTTYRALMYYKQKEGENIEILSTSLAILLKPEENPKITRKDPLIWNTTWVSKNKKYLNLSIQVYVPGTGDYDRSKRLALKLNEVKEKEDGGKVYSMTLMNDQSGVMQYFLVDRYLSIPISSYNQNDEIELHVNASGSEAVRTIKLKDDK